MGPEDQKNQSNQKPSHEKNQIYDAEINYQLKEIEEQEKKKIDSMEFDLQTAEELLHNRLDSFALHNSDDNFRNLIRALREYDKVFAFHEFHTETFSEITHDSYRGTLNDILQGFNLYDILTLSQKKELENIFNLPKANMPGTIIQSDLIEEERKIAKSHQGYAKFKQTGLRQEAFRGEGLEVGSQSLIFLSQAPSKTGCLDQFILYRVEEDKIISQAETVKKSYEKKPDSMEYQAAVILQAQLNHLRKNNQVLLLETAGVMAIREFKSPPIPNEKDLEKFKNAIFKLCSAHVKEVIKNTLLTEVIYGDGDYDVTGRLYLKPAEVNVQETYNLELLDKLTHRLNAEKQLLEESVKSNETEINQRIQAIEKSLEKLQKIDTDQSPKEFKKHTSSIINDLKKAVYDEPKASSKAEHHLGKLVGKAKKEIAKIKKSPMRFLEKAHKKNANSLGDEIVSPLAPGKEALESGSKNEDSKNDHTKVEKKESENAVKPGNR